MTDDKLNESVECDLHSREAPDGILDSCPQRREPNRAKRVDCIRVEGDTCCLVETKPNNAKAKARGNEQITDGIEKISAPRQEEEG